MAGINGSSPSLLPGNNTGSAPSLLPGNNTGSAPFLLPGNNTPSAANSLPPPRTRIFKIIVIGDSGVGKTCLTYRFCAGKFPEKTEATIGVDFRERLVEIDGEKIKIQLWDTAGQERFRKSMVQHYYRNVHAVVFVYDVTNAASFRSLPAWIEECKQHALGSEVPRILVGNKCDLHQSIQECKQHALGSEVPRILVGNKCDLHQSIQVCKQHALGSEVPRILVGNKCDLHHSIQVGTDAAQQFADTHSMPVFETSAKNPNSPNEKQDGRPSSDHVEAIFMTVAHKLKSQKPLVLSQPAEGGGSGGGTVRLNMGRMDQNTTGEGGRGGWGCSC